MLEELVQTIMANALRVGDRLLERLKQAHCGETL
jgi:hypothetical protein